MIANRQFQVGDRVRVRSVAYKSGDKKYPQYTGATIIFAHPEYGWCSYRMDHPEGLVESAFNEYIYFEDEHIIDEDDGAKV